MVTKPNNINMIGCLLLLAPWNIQAEIVRSTPQYRIRSAVERRDLQAAQFDPFDMLLSFSDDGAEREDEFYLDIFDTPEILTNSESPMVISNAMNFFLLEELNEQFDELNAVEQVSSEIVHLKTRNGTYVNSDKIEVDRIGTEARMKVILRFEQTPSPVSEDVEYILKYIMSDLSFFVTNLTSSISEDNELSGVYEAIRREIRPPVLIQPPDENIIVDISEGEGQNGGSMNPRPLLVSTLPIVVGAAVLVAAVVFFVFRKREKPKEPESVKDSAVIYEYENELFSLDRSVGTPDTKTPTSKANRIPQDESSIQYSMSTDSGLVTDTAPGCDSIFSGIDTDLTSVLSLASPKSMMTGFTCESASTIRASNTHNNKNKKKTRPKSPVGGNSVFAFLDPIEDADEEEADELELMERAQPDIESGSAKEINENACSSNDKESTDGTKSSSSSSLESVSVKLPGKSKEENQTTEVAAGASAVPVSRTVSHVLADLENMETSISSTPRESATPRGNEATISPPETDREKEDEGVDNSNAGVATRASNLIGGFFKGMRNSDSAPNSPTSSPIEGGALGVPSSPMQEVGRHWLTSSGKKPLRRIPVSPKVDSDVDYDMMLSQPSPTEEDYNDSRGFNDTINDSLQIVDKAPEDPPELDPSGGRRHAGDKIGGDGSALYQASAMKPTDWSVKSSDAGSVGSSTIGDEASQNQSNDENSRLASESKKSVTASRQLISDLVWLEKKIATVRGETADESLLSVSNDNQDEVETESFEYSSTSGADPSNIVVRDCFAPPGKLQIVIHSTKDGPAVHTVKDGSSLGGEIFPGDLIISVDNLDTRTCTAEEVMKMMASRGDHERKITVLRFLEEA